MAPEELTAQQQASNEQKQEHVYAAALRILSEDLYPRKLEVIREYIQNASDAIDDWRKIADVVEDRSEPQIKISIQGRSLGIYDNGIGMGQEEIAKLNRIAYSEKKAGEGAGYKGIGRLAGIAVAEKLKVSSTCYGEPTLYNFEFRSGDMRRDISEKKRQGIQELASVVIDRHTSWWQIDIDPADHYTFVELWGIEPSCDELLDEQKLIEYVGDIGPVDFSPDFKYGDEISEKLSQFVPDYSPKAVYLSKADGKKIRIFKPYRDSMEIAEPGYLEIADPENATNLLAFAWHCTNAGEILGEMRPIGRIFAVGDGESAEIKRRFAGLVYKLFGFTIGDRSLPERTLWTKARARALWFTGEIHIVDKSVTPTTDRSNFVENEARAALYTEARKKIPPKLNELAERISNNRKAYQDSEKIKRKLETYERKLENGEIDRADLRPVREEIEEGLQKLKVRKCTDKEIDAFKKQVLKIGVDLKEDLKDPKKLKSTASLADLASELKMASKARKVFLIIMETLQQHFANDKDEYHIIAKKVHEALRKRY